MFAARLPIPEQPCICRFGCIFEAKVDVSNKNRYLAEAVTKMSFAKKRSEIFGKTHRKTSAQEPLFSLQPWNFLKKETP